MGFNEHAPAGDTPGEPLNRAKVYGLPPMPIGRYIDPDFAALEDRHVWRKSWITAAHVSEIAEPDSYKLLKRLGLSIIISRGKDGVVRAFHNVCRHRGARLITESGRAPRFVCSYHGWSFKTDGALAVVPEASDFPCLDKSANGLVPVRCEIWRGYVFINLDADAPPLLEFFEPAARQYEGFPLESFVVKGSIEVEVPCNWKVAYDNFLEIYHVKLVHPKSIAPYLDPSSFTISLMPNGNARFETIKKSPGAQYVDIGERQALSSLFENKTVGVPFFPNGFTALDPVAFAWQTFWPISHNRSIMEVLIMGAADNNDEAFWAATQANMRAIVGEDAQIFGGIQSNLEGGAIDHVSLSSQERAIYWYHQEIDRKIGRDLPGSFALKPVLRADQMQAKSSCP